MRLFSFTIYLLSALLLAACAGFPGSVQPTATVPPTASPAVPTPNDAPLLPPKAVLDAQKALADLTGVSVDQVKIRSVKEAEWSDSCLGLGGPAESCLAAVTPGFHVLLEVNGQVYEYRTDREGTSIRSAGMVLENQGQFAPVVQALAKHQSANAADFQLVRVEPVQWPDACLGYINPAELCAQALTPGFKVFLNQGGQEVEVHTDAALTRARLPGGVEILAP